MKKTLLSLALSLMIGGAAMAAPASDYGYIKAPAAQSATSRAATDDGYELRFSGDVANWTSATRSTNITYVCYLYISPEIATQLAGNKLTDVTFSSVIRSVAAGLQGSAFVSEDIDGDPVTSTAAKITNGLVNNEAKMQTITLDEPYEIKEGTGFYFGYKVEKCKVDKDYPIAVDAETPNSYGGYVKLYSATGANKGTVDLAKDLGLNMVLYATTVGDKKELNNVFAVGNVSFGKFTMPVLDITGGMKINLPICNFGSNALTSIEYATSVNGSEPVANTLEINLPANTNEVIQVPVPDVESGENQVTFSLSALNGVPTVADISTSFVGVNGAAERKFVVEEGTGTWCGWCPRGIVGMESMSEKYPEKFIGIAVHSGDEFEVASYTPLINKYFSGFPSCIVNRDPYYSIDPSFEVLEEAYEAWLSQVAVADINLEVTKLNTSGTKLEVKTNTKFGINNDKAKYAIAFVVLENGLTAMQSNYYAGGSNGAMGGWESKASTTRWTYLDTARGIYDCWGLSNSVPSTVQEGEEYEYTHNLILNKIKNIDETSIVALLLDTSNGTILNATKVAAADYKTNGINDVTVDDDAPAVYYNLQGVQMSGTNMPAGVYIVKKGNKAEKTIVR